MTSGPDSLQFSKASRIVGVTLVRAEGGLVLHLKTVALADRAEAEWRFTGVTQLRFRGQTTELLEVVILLYEDIAPRGWEALRYAVSDSEESFASFYCADIELVQNGV